MGIPKKTFNNHDVGKNHSVSLQTPVSVAGLFPLPIKDVV